MTTKQWMIIFALVVGVFLVFLVGGLVAINLMVKPVTIFDQSNIPDVPTEIAARPSVAQVKSSATPAVSPTPTTVPTERPTATRVIQIPTESPFELTPVVEAPSSSQGTTGQTTSSSPSTAASSSAQSIAARGPIPDAMNKAQAAKVFRIEYDWHVQGTFPDIPAAWGTKDGVSLFNLSGIINGKDSDITLKGILAVLFTGDVNQNLQLLSISDKLYIHGPVPLLGAPENRWYVSTNTNQASITKSSDFTDVFSNQSADLSVIRRTGAETLDGKRCDVYTADKAATVKLFQSLDSNEAPSKDSLGNVDTAEAKFWVCDDGYFHQMLISIAGRNKDKPSEKISFQLKLHLWDFNGNLRLTPPSSAVPLQMPFLNFATPTKVR